MLSIAPSIHCIRMNLLIAIMGDSYEKVKESERVQALRERAQIIVEAERTNPSWHKYHKYMHIAEAADVSTSGAQKNIEWEGITGRVKQLLELQTAEVKAETAELKAETADAKVERAELKAEFKAELKMELAEVKAETADAKAEVMAELAEVKALLATLVDRSK